MKSTQSSEDDVQAIVLESIKHLQPGSLIFPRALASEILQHVGMHGEYGGVVDGISPFLIGVAVRRLVSNYTEGDEWKIEFLKGLFFNPNTTINTQMQVVVNPEDRFLA
jgi:hypothetical protein